MALGCYHITTLDSSHNDKKDEQLKYFTDENQALVAFQFGKVTLRHPILVKIKDELVRTSIGRIKTRR
jgi:hypothetical protein